MGSLRVVTDEVEARHHWEEIMPRDLVTDLWEVRACFHRHFKRPVHFILDEKGGLSSGLLPLSWVDELSMHVYFPGETWHGKTWLEQNLIVGDEPSRLLDAVPGPYHIRYLSPRCAGDKEGTRSVDETGYLFTPPRFGYDFNGYLENFSGKSLKRVRREMERIGEKGLSWRYDRFEDVQSMIAMSIHRFGRESYFSDPRFRGGFTEMLRLFDDRGWLRITTALIGGEIAAVDAGVLYEGVYTLMGGGTNPDFPGIAKVINMHHMERACDERLQEVDFLCGDFNWKKMFHLQERPLYLAARSAVQAA